LIPVKDLLAQLEKSGNRRAHGFQIAAAFGHQSHHRLFVPGVDDFLALGNPANQPEFLNRQIHDDDFAVERVLRLDVGIGGKKFSQGLGDERAGRHRERQGDAAARFFGKVREFDFPILLALQKIASVSRYCKWSR